MTAPIVLRLFVVALFLAAMRQPLPSAHAASGTPVATVPCHVPAVSIPSPTAPLPGYDAASETPEAASTLTPEPDPDAAVDPRLDGMTAVAAERLTACWNARDWHAVAVLVSPRFLQTALGIDGNDERATAAALAALDLGPMRVEPLGSVSIWSDGRGAVEVLYFRGSGTPSQAIAARWFFIAKYGVVRFDEEALLPPPPLGDRVTIGFGIADDQQPLAWAGAAGGVIPALPVTALHGANRGRQPHTFQLAGGSGAILGLLTLPPWSQGDLVLRDLPPGSYQLRDPAVAGSVLSLVVGDG